MKKTWRIFSILLIVCVLMASFSSCGFLEPIPGQQTTDGEVTEPAIVTEEKTPETQVTDDPGQDDPEPVIGELSYTLTQEDLDAFTALLEACSKMFTSDTLCSEDEMQELLDSVDEAFYHIVTQSSLAYIYYCMDQDDEEASDAYLFASGARSDLYDAYMEMCIEVRDSGSTASEFFFADWTEEDFAALDEYSPEMAELSHKNHELIVEYRALSDRDFMDGAARIYVEMIKNNNRIAELNGYDNYWEYAYTEVYGRDYDKEAIETLRRNVKETYLDLCEKALDSCISSINSPAESQWNNLYTLWYEDFGKLNTNYIFQYIDLFDDTSKEIMGGLFDEQNSFFTNAGSSYAGAFTDYLYEYERPICYFGSGYHGAYTVIHEMGHYYSAAINQTFGIGMDLAEMQSQGNEMLFTAYLNSVLNRKQSSTNVMYQMYSALTTVIVGVIIDDFEQRCYEAETVDIDFLNDTMAQVISEYKGADWLKEYVTDMNMYWRYVALESPVYYISYSVSMLASMEIYVVAQTEGFEKGQQIYLSITVLEDPDVKFLDALEAAGLSDPFGDDVSEAIKKLI